MSWSAEKQSAGLIDTKSRFIAGEPLPEGLLPTVITRSWQRCVEKRAVLMQGGRERITLSRHGLAEHRDRSSRLIFHSEPVMEQLHEQIAGTSSVVVLTDATGVVLHSVGDPDFLERAEQAHLRPGGIWSEEVNGTNAIGTALVEQRPVSVHRSEHFLDSNHFLTCSAAPIFDPAGSMLGVLDVSSDSDTYHSHTMALVRMSAQMIENQFFSSQTDNEIQIRFHIRPEFIGTLYEGIAVFSLDGRFVAGNRGALVQLGLDRYDAVMRDISSIFEVSVAGLFEQARLLPQPVIKFRVRNGVELYGRVKFGASVSPVTYLPIRRGEEAAAPSPAKTVPAPLAALDLGDPGIASAIRKAGKIIGRDIPLMIEGESGSGKEVFARAFHAAGPRCGGPFVAINCAAIPEQLIESELFGYREGAFTGARRSGSTGKIQEAHGGTLFLDEIGDMPVALQARLLRVLQDRTVTPLGSTRSSTVDFFLVCATNRRLRDEVASGRFREDLYYRLNGLSVTLPPLRTRQDKLALAASIVDALAPDGGRAAFTANVLELFLRHNWPGNVRQMRNVIRTALALSDGEPEITVDHLPEDFLEQVIESVEGLKADKRTEERERLEDMELSAIKEVLQQCGGNVSAAARKLGVSRSTLYRKSKKNARPFLQR